jgi:ATP-binding cassette subfamily F protein uup
VAILIDLQNVAFHGHDRTILENLTLTVSSGDRIGVVGINGTGKSTMLNILAGTLAADQGVIRRGRGVHVGHLAQNPVLAPGTVRSMLGEGWKIDSALSRLGMLDEVDTDTAHLSQGQMKRVALAQLFAESYDFVILDEPTNHLDLNAIEWLEQQISSFAGAVVMVSHDRFLLDQVTTRMVEIDRGKVYLHAGGYARLLEAQAEREEQAANAEQTRRNMARRELAWLRRGVKARSTKPQARIDAAERLLAKKPEFAARANTIEFDLDAPRLGTSVIKVHNVSFSYPNAPATLRDVNLELGPGDRIGIVGPNGAGKSTLINLLALRSQPSTGTVKHGPTVVASYLEQHGGSFDTNASVQELVAGPRGVPGSPADIAVMKNFWFTGSLPQARAKELSGGERRRLQILLALVRRPNVLFLDEPTNDLDLETIRLIEEFLSQWSGTLVVVSHDRAFLSRTTDRLLEVHDDGTISDVAGGIDAWIARRITSTSGSSRSGDVERDVEVSRGRQLRDAEKNMTQLARRKATLSEKIVASSDFNEQVKLGAQLDQVCHELELAEELWLSLHE